jgi:hypothetical protein
MQVQFTTLDQVIDALIAKSNVLGNDRYMMAQVGRGETARDILANIVYSNHTGSYETITDVEFDAMYRVAMYQYQTWLRFYGPQQ